MSKGRAARRAGNKGEKRTHLELADREHFESLRPLGVALA